MTDRDRRPEMDQILAANSADPLPAEARDALGRELRRAYAQIVNEPLPDRFAKLLEQLNAEAATAPAASTGSDCEGES